MPFAGITTNVAVDAQAVAQKLSAFLARAVGKPEQWVMCAVRSEAALVFGGKADPAAYVELKSIGLAQGACADLSAGLCAFVQAECGVPPQRVYIEFKDLDGSWFGWNAGTF